MKSIDVTQAMVITLAVTAGIIMTLVWIGGESIGMGAGFEMKMLAVGVILAAFTSAIGFVYQSAEHKRARKERNLGLVQGYSGQITELKNKEKNLNTKSDCETYAQNYVDLMDQVAYLCNDGEIPKNVAKYFENEFSYALTMIWWIDDNDLVTEKLPDGWINACKIDTDDIPNRSTKTKINYKKEGRVFDDKYYPWYDLMFWCTKNNLVPFDDDQLPDAMYEYEHLLAEEIESTLESIKDYTSQLTELKSKERTLKTKKDCETYAQNYVELMDQIAFLYKKRSISEDLENYFANEFSYALTLIWWMEKNRLSQKLPKGWIKDEKIKTKEIPGREYKTKINFGDAAEKEKKGFNDDKYPWNDLMNWCTINKFEPFDDDQLPDAMYEYDQLPEAEIERTLTLIKGYGEKLTDLTRKEDELRGPLSCELYAISYLDILDAIAFLYRRKIIEERIAEYFGNNFSYGLTLLKWLEDRNLMEPIPIYPSEKKGDQKTKKEVSLTDWLSSSTYEKFEVGNEYPWTDFLTWAKRKKIEAFDDKHLPVKMLNTPKQK